MSSLKIKYSILRINGSPRFMSSLTKGIKLSAIEYRSELNGVNIAIEEDELNANALNSIKSDRTVLGYAATFPITLIEPIAKIPTSEINSVRQQWGIAAVKANLSSYTGKGVSVAVLDSGIDMNHDAFKYVNLELNNFTDETLSDQMGHGTHCAGTIFGSKVDGIRIGIATNIDRALIGKVIGNNGGTTKSLIEGIVWAMNSGANIISMSLGIDFPGYVEHLVNFKGMKVNPATSLALGSYRENIILFNAVANFVEERSRFINPCLIVCACGNESNRPDYEILVSPPAITSGFISVGALDSLNRIAPFSNSNPVLCAPGVEIISANLGGGLVVKSGTSMAAPHVAGVSALWADKLLYEGIFTIDSLRNNLIQFCSKSVFSDYSASNYGNGIVQSPID